MGRKKGDRTLTREIGVESFGTCLFWPLTLDLPPASDKPTWEKCKLGDFEIFAEIDRQIDILEMTGHWEAIEDGIHHLGDHSSQAADAYAEYAYFHDFFQRFQFTTLNKSSSGRFRLFKRQDVGGCRVTLRNNGSDQVFVLNVDRLNLYVYGAGLAVLVLEVSGAGQFLNFGGSMHSVTLADVMSLLDRMRRAHAPFIDEKGEAHVSQIPIAFEWLDRGGQSLNRFDCLNGLAERSAALFKKAVNPHDREMAPFDHWSWLLSGKAVPGWVIAPGRSNGFTWRHVCDDRLPIITRISLPDAPSYRSIHEGDWMRLCFVDGPGNDPYPYAKDFLVGTWSDHAYDRYHHLDATEVSDPPVRYLFCAYAFTAVGCGDFFDTNIAKHMRQHYFQMMLVVQVEFAMILAFSSRISLAISDFDDHIREYGRAYASNQLQVHLQWIERDFLQFMHRFRFTGISSQLQASEMFDRLRKVVRVDIMFADLKDELSAANDFLGRQAEQQRLKATEGLNSIITVGAVISIAFAFLSLPDMSGNAFLRAWGFVTASGSWWNAGLAMGSIAVMAVLAFGFSKLNQNPGMLRPSNNPRQWLALGLWFPRSIVEWILAAIAIGAIVSAGFMLSAGDRLPAHVGSPPADTASMK